MDNMNITAAQYIAADGQNAGIQATIDGTEMSVPLDPANRHYTEIMRQVAAGTLTIAEAEEMDKRTVSSAHARIDGLEKEVVAIKTEMDIQFKDLFNRVKRLEAIMIGTSGFIIVLLLRMNMLS